MVVESSRGGGDAGLGAQLLVAHEPGRRALEDERDNGIVAVGRRGTGVGSGARALLVHQGLEALVVDRQPLLGEQDSFVRSYGKP